MNKIYDFCNTKNVEDIIYHYKILKNKNQGLKSIFQNLNKEINELKIEESAYIKEIREIHKLIRINEEKSKEEGVNVNSLLSEDFANEIIKLKENNAEADRIYGQIEEKLRKLMNFFSNYDLKLQNLMNILNIFDIMKCSKSLASGNKYQQSKHFLPYKILINQLLEMSQANRIVYRIL